MNPNKPVVKKCPMCGKLYKLGYNGIRGQCDTCAGNERGSEDIIWPPGVTSQTFIPVDGGEEFTATRPHTFKR